MPFIYVPILKARKGEFDAVSKLSEKTIDRVVPWFDVPRLDEKARKKSEQRAELPVETFLNKTASCIATAWTGKSIFIDLPRWATNAQTESGEHVIPYLQKRLELLGIAVNPVVDYISWDDPVYINALKGIVLETSRNFCIRLNMDIDTVGDIKADPDYITERLSKIVDELNIIPSNTGLLIDFGDVSNQLHTIVDMVDNTKQAISIAQVIGFSKIMIAGSSLPASIELAVNSQNSTGFVLRKEMVIWRTLLSENPSLNIIFADYGVRNPTASDESLPFPNANGKIRYTIDMQYLIARGYSLNCGSGYNQFKYLAQTIFTSKYYLGSKFSWGDERISYYSKLESQSGNQTTWITIDTNHHVETVVMEILEFNRELTAKKARSLDEV